MAISAVNRTPSWIHLPGKKSIWCRGCGPPSGASVQGGMHYAFRAFCHPCAEPGRVPGAFRLTMRGACGRVTQSLERLKPPPDRLYGRGRGHKLRARQETLLAATLPRLALRAEQAADPLGAFGPGFTALWLEVGFGGGEHALAQIAAHPEAALIACEVFDNGVCSL